AGGVAALGRLRHGELRVKQSAGPPITITMPAKANGMVGGVATQRMMTIRGHTSPGARVQLKIGNTSFTTGAGMRGNYSFRVGMPHGKYVLSVRAKDAHGNVVSAAMSATRGDAVIAWIDTMIEVARADAANVGLVSRTMAM